MRQQIHMCKQACEWKKIHVFFCFFIHKLLLCTWYCSRLTGTGIIISAPLTLIKWLCRFQTFLYPHCRNVAFMTAAPRLTKRQTKKRAARSFDAGRLKEKKKWRLAVLYLGKKKKNKKFSSANRQLEPLALMAWLLQSLLAPSTLKMVVSNYLIAGQLLNNVCDPLSSNSVSAARAQWLGQYSLSFTMNNSRDSKNPPSRLPL